VALTKAYCGQQEARIEALEKEVEDLKETKEQILVLQTQVGFCTGFGIQH
jgi:hypothetical protein